MINWLLVAVVLLPCAAATIDGAAIEWQEAPVVSDVWIAGKPDHPKLGTLYGMWEAGKFYGYQTGPIRACDSANEYWAEIDGVKDMITDRVFVNPVGCIAEGMEWSIAMPEGEHTIKTHVNYWYDRESQTGSFPPATVVTGCSTAVALIHAEVIPFQDKALVVSEWAPFPIGVSVYGDAYKYKGEATCFLTTCVFVDHYPEAEYWLMEDGVRHGPINAKVLLAETR